MGRSIDSLRPAWRASLVSDGAFLGAIALIFIASAGVTIYWSLSAGMSNPWILMPGQSWISAAASFLVMWTVMMLAMMLPSLVPMLVSYRRLLRKPGMQNLGRLTALAGAGYFFLWALFGLGAYLVGSLLASASMQVNLPALFAPMVTGLVLVLAGSYQLTGWKARQLMRCWDCQVSPASSWRYGLSLGWHCILCCAGFMLVLLVTGVMNLAAMALVAVAITVERLGQMPERTARLLGVLLILAGILVIARGLVAA